jgi:hypothetical protein
MSLTRHLLPTRLTRHAVTWLMLGAIFFRLGVGFSHGGVNIVMHMDERGTYLSALCTSRGLQYWPADRPGRENDAPVRSLTLCPLCHALESAPHLALFTELKLPQGPPAETSAPRTMALTPRIAAGVALPPARAPPIHQV